MERRITLRMHSLLPLLLGIVLWLGGAHGEGAVAADESALQGVTREQVELKLQELEADSDLDDDTRKLLTDLYQQSIGNLEAYAANIQVIAEYEASIEEAPAKIEVLKRENQALRKQGYEPDIPFDSSSPTSDIAQELLKTRASLTAVESDIRHMRSKVESEQKRLSIARQELATASDRQAGSAIEIDASKSAANAADIKKATDWLQQTTELALGSEIRMLDQELLSHTVRMELLKAQIQRREHTAEQLAQHVAEIEALLGARRQVEADDAIALAQKAQLEAEGKDPLLIQVATENARLSKKLLNLADQIDIVSRRASAVENQVKELEENYNRVRQKLEVAGMNRALGRVLQDQRGELPRRRTISAELRSKGELISEITLDQLIIDEQLKELRDLDAYADDLMDRARAERHGLPAAPGGEVADGLPLAPAEPVPADEKSGMKPEPMSEQAVLAMLKELLIQRVELLKKISSANSAYLQALSDFEFAQRRLVEVVKNYDGFLSERLLWVRSVSNPNIDSFAAVFGDVRSYFNARELRYAGHMIVEIAPFVPIMLLGLLASLLLMHKRRDFRAYLLESNRFLGNPVKDHFSYTAQSLLVTILLSSPGPLMLATIGWKLMFTSGQTAVSAALSSGLLWVSFNWFYMLLFYNVCRPEGLGHRHFRWHGPALIVLRKEMMGLMLSFLPVGFLTVVMIDLDPSALEWGVTRLGLIISSLAFALFFWSVLRRQGRVMRTLVKAKGGVLLVRLRWVWMALAILIPMTLVGLTMVGYVYTAGQLLGSFVRSFWVVLVLVLLHQLCVRWLRMTASKLHYEVLQEEQARELQNLLDGQASDTLAPENEDDDAPLDLMVLGRDSLKVVNILTGFVAVIGFLAVWSEVLPALGYLNNIQLWDSVGMVGNEAVMQPVTLADVGLSLLIVGVGYFLYRNLPSILELVLMQVFKMPTSTRYTVITLVRYTILSVSIVVVAYRLGFEWSKFQWLVAALGVGIGFGLQEIVANFISGLIILFERPIRVGDRVTVGDVDGFVSRIRIRATTILTLDRQELLVPNKEFITGTLLNWSLTDRVSRLIVNVGVAYGSDVQLAMSIIARVAEANELILDDPAPFVTFEGFGDNTLNLCLRCYLDEMEGRLVANSELHEAINKAFSEAGIEIAFPQVDVHFDQNQPLHIRLQRGLGS